MMQVGDPRYAGFWRRFGAGIVDASLFMPLSVLFTLSETQSRPAAFLAAILNNSIFYFYVLPMTARYGATLGKLATGIRVIPADGTPLSWRHVWLRSSVDLTISSVLLATNVFALSRVPYEIYRAAPWDLRSKMIEEAVSWYPWMFGLLMLWLLSEFIVIFLNPRRRAIHDFIAGTVVIVSRQRSPHKSAPDF